ncbi:MAG: hypothetical protein ACK40G_05955 [Cytophagaceae bacterium]
MKNSLITKLAVCFVAILFLAGCKKEKEEVKPKKTTQSDQTGSAAADEGIENVNDFVNNKVGNGTTKTARISGRVEEYQLPCGVVSVDSTLNNQTGKWEYKMKYGDKNKCTYTKKGGEIVFGLESGTSFNQVGAVYKVTFINYTVQADATGEIVTVNGTVRVTNVKGGYAWEVVLDNSKTVEHKVRGSLNITYSNNESRVKNYFQYRTWSNSSAGWPGLTFEVDGDSINGAIRISETGKTLDGNHDYYNQVITPLKWNNCGSTWAGPYKLKFGNVKMNISVPNVVAYAQVEAGYKFDPATATGSLVNDCSSDSYKLTFVYGSTTITKYQLY